jgi:hypothetical protein
MSLVLARSPRLQRLLNKIARSASRLSCAVPEDAVVNPGSSNITHEPASSSLTERFTFGLSVVTLYSVPAEGVPRDADGRPDFHYVATHICDSVKRRLKAGGAAGLQGEFGIGWLSFWTVEEELTMTSTGADQRVYQMIMRKGDPGYTVNPRRALFGEGWTKAFPAIHSNGLRVSRGDRALIYREI